MNTHPLQKKIASKELILASQSPRRKELLARLDLPFTTLSLNADESYPPHLKREKITEFICQKKAEAYTEWKDNQLLITADTIVWMEGEALGKPSSLIEAKQILHHLSGKTHEVATSVGLFTPEKKVIFSDITQVVFAPLTEAEIDYYVNTYQPLDKAGSYGIQEWIGAMSIVEMKGSYFNVMGFPIQKVYQALLHF